LNASNPHTEGKQIGELSEAGSLRIGHAAGPVHVLQLIGELDIASAPHLEAELKGIEGHPTEIIIDLSELTFVDSTGLRILLMANALTNGNGTTVGFLRGSGAVARTLELAGVEERLPFLD
jgi:anti-anti-sigma factor